MSELNVDTSEARSGALSTEEAALNLRDLPTDFEKLVEDAKSALQEDPGDSEVWGPFGSKHADHMNEVSEHAETLAENIGTSLDDIAVTESNAADEYSLARPPNGVGQDIGPF